MICYWKSIYKELQKVKGSDVTVWNITVQSIIIVGNHFSLLLTGEAKTVNVQAVNRSGIWRAKPSTTTVSHAIFNHKNLLKFRKGLHLNLALIDALKTKYFLKHWY